MEYLLALLDRLKPTFWDHMDSGMQMTRHMFNFRRIWIHAVAWTSLVAILPLIAFALADHNVIRQSIESEIHLQISQLVSNTRQTISFSLTRQMAALDFIIHQNDLEELDADGRLSRTLGDLKTSFGEFADIELIDASGRQRAHAGPHNPGDRDYGAQQWFQIVRDRGVYISEVYQEQGNIPQLFIAARSRPGQRDNYILRAFLDMDGIIKLLAGLQQTGQSDAFMINRDGILQTPSRYHGAVMGKLPLPIPGCNKKPGIMVTPAPDGTPFIFGVACIDQSPFVLMIIKNKDELMPPWYVSRKKLLGMLAISMVLITAAILSVATILVNRIYLADQKRVAVLHDIEYTNKMESVGRLAAGVAHEINNPLAIINEKVGLLKDLLLPNRELPLYPKLIGLINAVISSVERCGAITRRLLNFARHVDISIEAVDLKEILGDVLVFLGKEATYRSIEIAIYSEGKPPEIESDRGKLQQVFLNLFNNAFAALDDGGRLEIRIKGHDDKVEIAVADNGCGIPEKDLKRIFEPFFSSKTKQGGTGLGLSITYGLVQELGGSIIVSSRVGQGTEFVICLPVKLTRRKMETMNQAPDHKGALA